ncbi:nuclease domain-containing protein [Winogradskyella sediminis]|uniref:PD-(D/E)XK nuclease superfamily protein n=1 Tax=Winogradskyella sediminis TaxID=1382466 RepID=A0A1H1SNG7_9FLAO|nr:nuclease domain-containing protein [Winogradskyella sediminis]SDS49276.1 PD-(D/E)XK nuclease superfamily protein [Winogradskyella sediminis]
MEVFIYIADFELGKSQKTFQKYNLSNEAEIILNELSMVYFAVISQEQIDVKNFKLVFGVTSFNLGSGFIDSDGLYHYSLIIDKDAFNLSKNLYNIQNYLVRFYQLFLNELGFVKPQIIYNGNIRYLNQIKINSNKISENNFDLIVKSLMFNNYFDEEVLYKTSLPTDFSDFKNSFFESLKLLHGKIEKACKSILSFKHKSIRKYKTEHKVLSYSANSIIDDVSFDWLFQNLHVIENKRNFDSYDLKLQSKECKIKEMSQQVSNYSYNSYENRLILGYVKLYILKLNEHRKNLENKKILRSRYSGGFQEHLILKYNEIIDLYLRETVSYFNYFHNYFENVLKVYDPLLGFPKDSFSFLSLPHYKNCFELILLYNNLFSKDIKNNSVKSYLEIESFDKLFEVYVFYLIKDIVGMKFSNKYNFIYSGDNRNKLSGAYIFEKLTSGIGVTLYYENLPKEIELLTLFTTEDKKYNPDYVIELSINGYKEFIILDAKYKNYNNSERYRGDIKELTFKYLHGLGVVNNSHKVSGLYILYISEKEKFKRVLRKKFDILESENPILPSIAGISIDPKSFNFSNNYIESIINKHIEILKNRVSVE